MYSWNIWQFLQSLPGIAKTAQIDSIELICAFQTSESPFLMRHFRASYFLSAFNALLYLKPTKMNWRATTLLSNFDDTQEPKYKFINFMVYLTLTGFLDNMMLKTCPLGLLWFWVNYSKKANMLGRANGLLPFGWGFASCAEHSVSLHSRVQETEETSPAT